MEINFKHFNQNQFLPQTKFEKKVFEFLETWFSPVKDVVVKTSGSTGAPKMVSIEKEKMLNSAKMTCDFLKLEMGNLALIALPIEYISGKMMVVRALERKLALQISTPSLHPLENITETIDFCALTPLQVEHSLDKIHLIKKLIIGGAEVSENLKNRIHEALQSHQNNGVYETYGMSETLSHIALKQIFPIKEPCFTVLGGVEISQDSRGCLQIFAPKLNPNLLITNDCIHLISKQQFQFIGRLDFVINSGGLKIFPEELERLLKKELPSPFVFVGMPDEKLGQKLVLVIEGKHDVDIVDCIAGIKFENKLHFPKEILFLDQFPRAENGKILRKEILKSIQI